MTRSRPHALIIDDEVAIRRSLLAFLDERGYDIAIAANAEEAESLLCNQNFDAAVVDLSLPGESGENFILRAAKARPHMRFLIYTGAANFSVSAELAAVGIKPEHVFKKPVRSIWRIVDALDDELNIDTSPPRC